MAVIGDLQALQAQALRLAAARPELDRFAQRLQYLAETFAIDGLLALLADAEQMPVSRPGESDEHRGNDPDRR